MQSLVLAACAVSFAAGCQSPRAARIAEHAATFAQLDARTQQLVRDGLFDVGFKPELVYLALGNPNRRATRETAEGTVETWVYRNFVYGSGGAMRLMANTPGSKPYGPILSSSAPGGPSISSTKAGPVQPSVGDGADAPVGTLYIDFLHGRVIGARIEL